MDVSGGLEEAVSIAVWDRFEGRKSPGDGETERLLMGVECIADEDMA